MPSFFNPFLKAKIPKIRPSIGEPIPNIRIVKTRIEEVKYKSRRKL